MAAPAEITAEERRSRIERAQRALPEVSMSQKVAGTTVSVSTQGGQEWQEGQIVIETDVPKAKLASAGLYTESFVGNDYLGHWRAVVERCAEALGGGRDEVVIVNRDEERLVVRGGELAVWLKPMEGSRFRLTFAADQTQAILEMVVKICEDRIHAVERALGESSGGRNVKAARER